MNRFFAVENSYHLVSICGYDWTAGQAENPSSEDGNQRSERSGTRRSSSVQLLASSEDRSIHLGRYRVGPQLSTKASGARRSLNSVKGAWLPRSFTLSTIPRLLISL